MVIPLSSRARRAIVTLAALALGALFACNVVRQAYIGWRLSHPTVENLRKVLAIAPRNCDALYRLGIAYTFDLSAQDTAEGEAYLRQAVECSPSSSQYRFALATALEADGRPEDAIAAAQSAVAGDPHNLHQLWQSGSLLLRNGRISEAFAYFHQVLAGAPEYAPQVFSACWKSTDDGDLILSRAVPDTAALDLAYLQFLVAATPPRFDECRKVWNRLLARRARFLPQEVFPYLDALLGAGRAREVSEDWDRLTQLGVLPPTEAHTGENLIVNGGFETAPLNGGLDWRITPLPGVSVSPDSGMHHGGARSLAVRFEGLANLDFAGISERVPLEPHTRYRFSAFIKTRGLSTDSRPHFEVFDSRDASHPLLETADAPRSTDWTESAGWFETGPGTQLVVVRLRRKPAVGIDNRIEGTLWIDDVKLSLVRGQLSVVRGQSSVAASQKPRSNLSVTRDK